MKKTSLVISLFIILLSCNQKTDKQTIKTSSNEDSITDPNEFIGNHKSKVAVLGVFHFANPGLDSYKQKYDFNILDSLRQRELDEVLLKLAKYSPTKILLEVNRISGDSLINDKYTKYLNNQFDITDKHNEIYQIGFKLAKKLNHQKIYCSDAGVDWCGVNLDWENYNEKDYLKSRGQLKKATRYDYNSYYQLSDSLKTTQSLNEHLMILNNNSNCLKDHQAYLTETALTGAGDNYIGADAVARWYRRNLRIFANAYDLTNFDKQERVLLIYGSGHVWQLRQLFTDSPDFEYLEINDYLKK